MIAGLLHGRMHLNMQEFRQQNHMTFFSNVLAILELLQPLVFHSDHQRALQDCLLSFMRVLQVGGLHAVKYSLQDLGLRSDLTTCLIELQIKVNAFFCRTFRGLALHWSSSTSFCSSHRSTSPTMQQLPFPIYRSTLTSCSKYILYIKNLPWMLDFQHNVVSHLHNHSHEPKIFWYLKWNNPLVIFVCLLDLNTHYQNIQWSKYKQLVNETKWLFTWIAVCINSSVHLFFAVASIVTNSDVLTKTWRLQKCWKYLESAWI